MPFYLTKAVTIDDTACVFKNEYHFQGNKRNVCLIFFNFLKKFQVACLLDLVIKRTVCVYTSLLAQTVVHSCVVFPKSPNELFHIRTHTSHTYTHMKRLDSHHGIGITPELLLDFHFVAPKAPCAHTFRRSYICRHPRRVCGESQFASLSVANQLGFANSAFDRGSQGN